MKYKVSATTSALVPKIAALGQATSADLKERWRELYRTEPPRRISRDLLMRALAYRIQEKALGGLKPPRADCWQRSQPMPRLGDPSNWLRNRRSNRGRCCSANGTAPSTR
jgi:hypothetical protein